MIRISQLKLPITHTRQELEQKIARTLRLSGQTFGFSIRRQSLDARHQEDKLFVYTVDVDVSGEERILKRIRDKDVCLVRDKPYVFPVKERDKVTCRGEEDRRVALHERPVIVGSGPAGLFCAWYLARAGYAPLVVERGDEAVKRKEKVEDFWKGQSLDPDCNVQFGEGGAGTFSDGKLNTLVKDPFGRNAEVLKRFVKAGAPEEILYVQKPHLGTDQLIHIVTSLRTQVEQMGGSFRFRTKLTGLDLDGGRLRGVFLRGQEGTYSLPAQVCVLALGHSARDTFFMLHQAGVYMEAKPFAVGVRVEHPQAWINQAMYGEEENPLLGAASYKVTHTCADGRGVYSFCMCPGGYVVNASSEENCLCVNGMSYQARDSANANSAVIVTVRPQDYQGDGALAGIAFQRSLEQAAYRAGAGRIPVQRFEDFCKNRRGDGFCALQPCMKGDFAWANVREILPPFLAADIEEGIRAFDRKIKGFAHPDALLSGVESRSSSPVRIVRDPKTLLSNIDGIYPCGEGAGYAGGITSAAMDGLKMAEVIALTYR